MADNTKTEKTLGGWLLHVMRKSESALSLEEALHVIMDSLKEYFPCQSAAVVFIDDDTNELRIKTSRHISYTFVKKFHQNGPSPHVARVVMEQGPLMLNGIDRASPMYAELKMEHDFDSILVVPIICNQRGIGYIYSDRTGKDGFLDSDLLHLQVVGYLVGQLVEKFDLLLTSKELSQTDDASKAMKYKAFVPAFATELQRAQTHDYQLVLSLISVEAFRKFVDVYGIDEAHGLLADVVGIVRKNVRDMDMVARYGADVFILYLSGMTENESRAVLEAVVRGVESNVFGKADFPVTVAIGAIQLADAKAQKLPLQDILAALGRNLMDAPTKGRNRILMTPMPKL